MKQYIKIESLYARQILDSRGNPTIEVDVIVEGGTMGRASVPSGASTGSYEAVELRDNDIDVYMGKGVLKAVENINDIIAPEIEGMNVLDQVKIDNVMLELDGTENKKRLGANAILGVSLAVADAAAKSLGLSLYNYIGGVNAKVMPVPMMNILNGGKHADNSVNIQEFMIMPISASMFSEALRMCSEVFHSLKSVLKEKGYLTSVGDEGGFAPNLEDDEQAIELILDAIKKAGYIPGKDFKLALDVAATEMYEEAKKKSDKSNNYYFWKTDKMFTTDSLISYYEYLVDKYPIVSIEDGLAEEDWEGWKKLTKTLGSKIQLVGDDLFVTNTKRIEMARNASYTTIVSHRSGETEDTAIADLVVALNAGQIKTGAPCRTDRVAKYNELLRIEEGLDFTAKYLGDKAFFNIEK